MVKHNNFIGIHKWSLRYAHFFYFDTPTYLADSIFVKNKLNVRFGNEFTKIIKRDERGKEIGEEDFPYVGIMCRVRKRDADLFVRCMEELKKSMLICGHTDYEEETQQMIDKIMSFTQ